MRILRRCSFGIVLTVVLTTAASTQERSSLSGARLIAQTGHFGSVSSVAFSPDGRHIVSGSEDGTARLWAVSVAAEVRRFAGHAKAVRSVAFSPDGRHVLTGGEDGTARLWDVATGREVRRFDAKGVPVTSVAFSPDGQQVLAGLGWDKGRLWEVSGAEVRLFENPDSNNEGVAAVAFSPDGKQVMIGAHLWETTTGVHLRNHVGHTKAVIAVAFSPDGRHIVTGSRDGTARQWDDGREVQRFAHRSSGVVSVAFSPDARRVLTGGSDGARLWDVSTGKQLRSFEGEVDWVTAVAFSPDGRRVLLGNNRGTARSWDVHIAPEVRRFGRLAATAAVFSSDGRYLLAAFEDGSARLLDATTDAELARFEGHNAIDAVALSPDGRHVVTGGRDETARLWEAGSGKEIRRFTGHNSGVESVAFSPDGQLVLTSGGDDTARLWDAQTGKSLRRFEHEAVRVATFSPDGRHVFTGGGRDARLWDSRTGTLVRIFDFYRPQDITGALVVSAAFSPDGRHVITGGSSDARLWETNTGNVIWTCCGPGVDGVAFSPDGRHVLTVRGDDVRLRDAQHGMEVARFDGEAEGSIIAEAFSSDGRRVLTSDMLERSVRIWDAAPGSPVQHFRGQADPMRSVRFSEDGRHILTSNQDHPVVGMTGMAQLWETSSGHEVRRLSFEPFSLRAPALSPDGRLMVISSEFRGESHLRLVDVQSGRELHRFGETSSVLVSSYVFSPDGRRVLTGNLDGSARLWDVERGSQVRQIDVAAEHVDSVAFSPDGQRFAVGTASGDVALRDVKSGATVRTFQRQQELVLSLAFSSDGRFLLAGISGAGATLWDVATGQEVRRFEGQGPAAISADGRFVLTGDTPGARLWDAQTGAAMRAFDANGAKVTALAFSPDGRNVLTGSDDALTRVFDASTGTVLASLISFRDGTWTVVAPDGRFDTHDLNSVSGLFWVAPDDPLQALPIEIFMRDYYEPGLLTRILKGEPLPLIRDLTNLNRVQPAVSIVEVTPDPARSDRVRVVVDVANTHAVYGSEGSRQEVDSGVYDLRLFRDGQLVGYQPARDGAVPLDQSGKARVPFADIQLPAGAASVTFSAYAFNRDRVKSATANATYTPERPAASRKGRAYLIGMGVNVHENPAWNLRYAVNDATSFLETMSRRLTAGEYSDIVSIPLVSDGVRDNRATKADLETVLLLLAGKPVPEPARARILNADRIRAAEPSDLLLMSFSGHGFAGANGVFYLVAADTGPGAGTQVTDLLRGQAVSTDDLALWLRDVDAGQMALVVDACHSAASVGEGFKPGPMGSRGLGQLAYDKGMRLLAASQADDVALESNLLQRGLLSYVLMVDGLEAGLADANPKDRRITLEEWFTYTVTHVPLIAEQIRMGAFKPRGLAVGSTALNSLRSSGALQQPVMFDFATRRPNPVLVVIR